MNANAAIFVNPGAESNANNPAPPAPALKPRPDLRTLGQHYGALAAVVALVIFNAIFTRNFLSLATLSLTLSQVASIVIVATGMTLVVATGGIDLSVGSLMAISGALAPLIFQWQALPAPVGIVLGFVLPVLLCGLLGWFNGTLVTTFRIQPIVATLVLFMAGRGLAQALTAGRLQNFDNAAFEYIGRAKILSMPFQAYLMVGIVALAAWIVSATVFGRQILAVGGNENAALLAGIPTKRVKRLTYAICGLLAGIAGLIVVAQNKSADANTVGQSMELSAIAAIAIGGTPLTGGKAAIWGTLTGAILIQLIGSTLISHNYPLQYALVVNAVIMVLAVYIQRAPKV